MGNATNRLRTTAAAMIAVGLAAMSTGMQATSASWIDDAHFAAEVRAGTTTTLPPTTTVPPNNGGVTSGGIGAANPDTVISDIVWSLSTARQVCTVAHVTGASAVAEHWAIRVDLIAAPWYGSPAGQISLNGTGTLVIESPTTVLITGRTRRGGFNPETNNTPITNAQTALITICNYNNPIPPPADPSWYSVTATPGTWTDTQACVIVTAASTHTNLATNPFFFGWTATVDLTAAKARISDAGRTLNFVSWSPYPSGPSSFSASPASYNPPLDTYQITSGFDFALRALGGGHDSKTVTVCVNGY